MSVGRYYVSKMFRRLCWKRERSKHILISSQDVDDLTLFLCPNTPRKGAYAYIGYRRTKPMNKANYKILMLDITLKIPKTKFF